MNKKRVLNIIFYLFLIIVIGITIYINKDINSLLKRKTIKDSETYEKYKDLKYVTFNFEETIKTRFLLEQKTYDNMRVYIVNIDNKSILIELTESSLSNKKINLIKMKDDNISLDLKDSYNNENDKLNFVKGYYTNKNINKNEDITNLKVYIGLFIIVLCLLLMYFNLFKIIKRKN